MGTQWISPWSLESKLVKRSLCVDCVFNNPSTHRVLSRLLKRSLVLYESGSLVHGVSFIGSEFSPGSFGTRLSLNQRLTVFAPLAFSTETIQNAWILLCERVRSLPYVIFKVFAPFAALPSVANVFILIFSSQNRLVISTANLLRMLGMILYRLSCCLARLVKSIGELKTPTDTNHQ